MYTQHFERAATGRLLCRCENVFRRLPALAAVADGCIARAVSQVPALFSHIYSGLLSAFLVTLTAPLPSPPSPPRRLLQLMGEDAVLFKDKINYKNSNGGMGYAPHCDGPSAASLGACQARM